MYIAKNLAQERTMNNPIATYFEHQGLQWVPESLSWETDPGPLPGGLVEWLQRVPRATDNEAAYMSWKKENLRGLRLPCTGRLGANNIWAQHRAEADKLREAALRGTLQCVWSGVCLEQ